MTTVEYCGPLARIGLKTVSEHSVGFAQRLFRAWLNWMSNQVTRQAVCLSRTDCTGMHRRHCLCVYRATCLSICLGGLDLVWDVQSYTVARLAAACARGPRCPPCYSGLRDNACYSSHFKKNFDITLQYYRHFKSIRGV